jgi:hypothetical protein
VTPLQPETIKYNIFGRYICYEIRKLGLMRRWSPVRRRRGRNARQLESLVQTERGVPRDFSR